jgi:flagellar biogenesis protein FliO
VAVLVTDVLPALALLVGALLLLRRMASRGHGRSGGLKVVGRAALSRTATVAVVETDGRRFLVGGGDQQVQLLAELDPAAAPAAGMVTSTGDAIDFPQSTSTSSTTPAAPTFQDGTSIGPGTGLLDRLRAMTVRTEPTGPSRAALLDRLHR